MTPPRRAVLAWCAVSAATACLAVARHGVLAAPPLLHPGRLGGWWHQRPPLIAMVAIWREVLLWVGGYLVVVMTGMAVAGAAGRCGAAARLLRRWRLPAGRRLVFVVLGASAAGPAVSVLVAAPAGADPPAPGPAPVMGYLGPAAPVLRQVPRAGPARPVLRQTPRVAPKSVTPLPRPPARGTRAGTATPTGAGPPTTVDRTPPSPRPAAPPPPPTRRPTPHLQKQEPAPAVAIGLSQRQWTVQPGDDLWSIAERTLTAIWGRPPSTGSTATYWLSVIAANRQNLPDPANPSLLFPGDQVRLPPVPPLAAGGLSSPPDPQQPD